MDLNRAQLLELDNDALNKFKIDHGIPVLLVDTLLRQRDLPFSASDLLHVYTVVQPKRDPNTNLLKGNHYLRLRNPQQPHMRLGHALLRRSFTYKELSVELDEGAIIAREHNSSKGAILSFSSSSPTSDDDEEVPQLVRRRQGVATPVLLLSSNFDSSNDLGLDQPQSAGKDEIEHLYTKDNAANSSSGEVQMGPKFKKINPNLALTVSPEIDGSPSDALFHDKHKGRALKPEFSVAKLSKQATKLSLATVDQLKLDLAAATDAQDAGYVIATKAQNEATTVATLPQRDKALQDLAELQ
ncbi:hypothetical protein Acr_00g0072900 [Actinidia rufa]|uniref:Uncharacterized protein n=1 Tax=Actinidia rufa TaxID=165716 RepID=A0A7J0DRY5_9ERIC|nr:hypothetical protein Acr_00g0072900 [Actinidia rufa]